MDLDPLLKEVGGVQEILQRHCIQRGDFTLRSGGKSKYYYNGKAATLHPPTVRSIGELLVDLIVDSGAEAVGGPATGSIPIADAVGQAALSRSVILPTFYVRPERKEHGARELVTESFSEGDRDLISPGRKVAVVEDAITTGGSVKLALEVLESLGAELSIITVLVERHEGGGDSLRERGYDVVSIFRTDEEGQISVSEGFLQRQRELESSQTPP